MKQSPLKKSMIACLCAALCIVLPQALMVIPGTDGIYGLIHMPVLLCAFACGAGSAVLCAFLGLGLSFLVAGLPTVVMLPVLLVECLVASLLLCLMKRLLSFQNISVDTAICFAFSVLTGRLSGALLTALLFLSDGAAPYIWTAGYFLSSLPGMLIEMVLLPILVDGLINAGLVEIKKRSEAGNGNEKS